MGNIPKNLPATNPQLRRDVYTDIEQLIMIGFINKPIMINGLSIALRTPHPSDLSFIKSYGKDITVRESKVLIISRCIWRVEHQVILGDQQAFSFVYKIIKNLPKNIINLLYILLLVLLKDSNSLQDGVEPYSYEYFSRYLWKTLNNMSPCDPRNTGITGTDILGLNQLQKTWVFYNSIEDKRSEDLVSWSESKFIASAMVGKGIQKVNSTDQNNRKKEERYRDALRDAYFYYRKGVIDYDAFKSIIRGENSSLDNEADILEQEMQKVLTGEKDEHDLIVEMAERNMLEAIQTKNQEVKIDTAEIPKNTRIVGYTPEQMAKLLKQNQVTKPPKPQVSSQQYYFLDNFIKPKITPGQLVIKGDQISVSSLELENVNKDELLERDISLDDLLASRKILQGG